MKRAERVCFGFRKFVFDDGIHAAAARALMYCRAQLGQQLGVARGHAFYVARIGVPHPPSQLQVGSFAMDKPPETNTLHAPANKKVKHHKLVQV